MSFSAEMRDFLAAYKTGQQINASRTDQDYKEARTRAEQMRTDRENDPDTLQTAKEQATANLGLTKERMRGAASTRENNQLLTSDRLRTSASQRGYADERTGLLQDQRKLLSQPAPGSGLLPPEAGAIPAGPSTMETELYADGGLVDDGDEDDAGGVLDTEEAPAPANPPTDVSAQSRMPRPTRGLDGIISPQLVEDARREGMTWAIRTAGLDRPGAIRTADSQRKARAIAAGEGGLSEQEMQAARQAVDPEGKLTDSQRNLAALGSVYQFWANKGEPEKARRVAFQMIQYYRNASQRYAAIAAKAAEGGNLDLATKAALKAYANVPDGRDIALSPDPDGRGLVYYYTDEKGNEIAKGIATPQQLAASAMGLATGGFDRALLAAAGAAQDTGAVKAGGGGGRTQTSSDRAKEAETVGAEIEKLKAAWSADEKNKGKPVDENVWSEVANAAQHIYQQNPKATPSEVAHAAHKMLSMGDDPEKPGFKVKPGEDGKPNIVDFGGKLRVQLDDQQLEAILNARTAKVKMAVDKINKDMEELDKPGFTDKVSQAASNIGGILANDAKKFGGEVAEVGERIKGALPEEVVTRGRSAIDAAGRAISDGLAKIKDIDQATTPQNLPKTIERLVRAGIAAVKPEDKGAIPVDEAMVP